MKNEISFFERLEFRRQFLLGISSFLPNKFWKSFELKHNLQLSVHEDLPVKIKLTQNEAVVLLGIVFDALNPEHSESDIFNSLTSNSGTLNSLIKNTNPIAGRWVIIYQNENETYLFSDLSGLRQFHYATDGKNTWCASQPELIKTKIKLKKNDNKDVLNFLLNPKLGSRESLWGGTSESIKIALCCFQTIF